MHCHFISASCPGVCLFSFILLGCVAALFQQGQCLEDCTLPNDQHFISISAFRKCSQSLPEFLLGGANTRSFNSRSTIPSSLKCNKQEASGVQKQRVTSLNAVSYVVITKLSIQPGAVLNTF